ncbi:hypothetical protein [uncultured Microscilla sp.]|uniref:hypothetical protein n=1 Tax=uncultured Microscilla sp. TaxID=432653 RepID=UPI00263510FD|nr:hypothetical protein [uncultured Microscilla sp.]
MKKNRKQHKMLRDFYKDACSPQQMQQIKGGNCCNTGDDGDGGETPPPPPSAMARVVPLWQKWGSK